MEQIFIISREVKTDISREFCILKVKMKIRFYFSQKNHLKLIRKEVY